MKLGPLLSLPLLFGALPPLFLLLAVLLQLFTPFTIEYPCPDSPLGLGAQRGIDSVQVRMPPRILYAHCTAYLEYFTAFLPLLGPGMSLRQGFRMSGHKKLDMVRIRQDAVEISICLASSRRPRSFDLCWSTPDNCDDLGPVIFIVIFKIIIRGSPLLRLSTEHQTVVLLRYRCEHVQSQHL